MPIATNALTDTEHDSAIRSSTGASETGQDQLIAKMTTSTPKPPTHRQIDKLPVEAHEVPGCIYDLGRSDGLTYRVE